MTDKEILQLIGVPSARLTTATESDRDRVLRLAAEHNADLPGWCARHRRRNRFVTDAVIAVSFAAFVVITALPKPDGRYVSNIHQRAETIQTIEQTTFSIIRNQTS